MSFGMFVLFAFVKSPRGHVVTAALHSGIVL